jgi:hypothetical protein
MKAPQVIYLYLQSVGVVAPCKVCNEEANGREIKEAKGSTLIRDGILKN